LKYNKSVYNSSNKSVLENTPEKSFLASNVGEMNQTHLSSKIRDNFHKSAKKQLRMIDPKLGIQKLNHDASDTLPKIGSKGESSFFPSPFVPKNSDNRVVPGALMRKPIDFSKVMDEIDEQGDSKSIKIDEIHPSEVHRAEPYFEYFEKDTVKLLFQNKWQSKVEGYKRIIKEFQSLLSQENNQSEDSGGYINSFKNKKKECLNLIVNSIERGLNDKVLHVKLQALELYNSFIGDKTSNFKDLQNYENVISLLMEVLSSHNQKLKEKVEGVLQSTVKSRPDKHYDTLTTLLSLPPNKIKSVSKYNTSKLKFLSGISEADSDRGLKVENSQNEAYYGQLLNFVQDYLKKENILSRSIKGNIEN